MLRLRQPRRILLACVIMLGACAAAEAVIKAPLPLGNYVGQTKYIFVAKVEKYLPEKPAMILTVTEDIKDKAPYRKLPVVIRLAPKEKNENYIPEIMKRLAEGEELILFVMERGKQSTVFGFTNGSWFQMSGQKLAEDRREWGLVSGEPYLRRIFKGTTAELKQSLVDHFAKKTKLPEPNEKEEPGFGPELEKKAARSAEERCDSLEWQRGGGLFAVIPTVGLAAPVAILAVLFPTVFGGVLILFRQWLAFITVFSINSTLFMIYAWWPPFGRSWWGSEPALWFLMTLVALLGALWAWRRQIFNVYSPTGIAEAPRKTENSVLLLLSAVCFFSVVAYVFFGSPTLRDAAWDTLLVFSLGIWFAAAIRLGQTVFAPDSIPQTRSTEGMILGVIAAASVCIMAARWGGQVGTEGSASSIVMTDDLPRPELPEEAKRWTYAIDGTGIILSAPLVHGDRVYVGLAQPPAEYGTLYCLDRTTGKKIWEFIDDGSLKKCFSTPVVADGKLYFGEGWHDSKECKVYCLEEIRDEATGEKKPRKVWEFQTASQTEASPVVVDGKVYIGAGNQGFLCLDAKGDGNGRTKLLWQFDASKIPGEETALAGKVLRFGGGATIVGKRVFFATGVDRFFTREECETRMFCVDADTGTMIWQHKIDLPCWGAPAVKGDLVYFSLGTGDYTDDAIFPGETPGGGVVCLYGLTGKEAWRFRTNKGMLDRPVVDAYSVYAGCRDNFVYCLERLDGKTRWQADMGSPVLSRPLLIRSSTCDQTASVIAVGSDGKISCLDPHTGQEQWKFDLGPLVPYIATPRAVVGHTPEGDRRQIFFAATLNVNRMIGSPVVYCLEDFIKAK